MHPRRSRRSFLKTCSSLLAAGAAAAFARESRASTGLHYEFVNKTGGRFADRECFWSLSGGRDWHSFGDEPSVACPTGNGRVYFRLGTAPKNFDDRRAYWDFIEYAYAGGRWNGNTTQVDAFGIPLTIELGDKRLGITTSRKKLFDDFRSQAPAEFRDCAATNFFILSPCRAGFGENGPHADYFDRYIADVWKMYREKRKTPSGQWIGQVADGALTFTPAAGGKPLGCPRKPTTQEVFLGTGILSGNPQFCAAINRHVLADPADWKTPEKFYQAEPCNWYAKFLHQNSIDHKAYGFCYDDVSEQAAFFSGQSDKLKVTLYWD